MARRLGMQVELAVAPAIVAEAPIYLLMSKVAVTAEQVDNVHKVIESLQKSGELERIINSYRLTTN